MIFNFGSINIDHVYRVSQMPAPGETLEAKSYDKFIGGKGLNQSIAVARAHGDLTHVGAIGPDGTWLLEAVSDLGVGTDQIQIADTPTGHAIIFVDDNGENQIVLVGGANLSFSEQMVESVLASANPATDWVLLQNETNLIEYVADQARLKGIKIAYSAAPFDEETALAMIEKIDLLAVNELEAQALAGALKVSVQDIPVQRLLVTKGSKGAAYYSDDEIVEVDAISVDAVDTTGAGDTFLGSFLARFSVGNTVQSSLNYAAAASAIQVTREGAATAIPTLEEVSKFMKEL